MVSRLTSFLGSLGKKFHDILREVSRIAHLLKSCVYWIFIAPLRGKKSFRKHLFLRELAFMGNQSIPIVMITASGSEENRNMAREVNPQLAGFLVKPFKRNELLDLVQQYVK